MLIGLDDLCTCLLKIVGERCSTCPEIVNPLDERSFTKTKCGHIFCLTCLDDRAKNCPLCPSKLMYYAKRAAVVAGAVVIIGGVVYLIKTNVEQAQLIAQQAADNTQLVTEQAIKNAQYDAEKALLVAQHAAEKQIWQEAVYAVVSTSTEAHQTLYDLGCQARNNQSAMTPISITTLASTSPANTKMPSIKSEKVGILSNHILAMGRLGEVFFNNTPIIKNNVDGKPCI